MASKQISIRIDEQVVAAIERLSDNRSQGFEHAARSYLMSQEAQGITPHEEELLADFDATCEDWRSA